MLLCLALANRALGADTTSELLAKHIGDEKVQVLIKTVVEKIPTEAVIFDVATERGVMHGNQMLTQIMYRQLLEHLNYARDLDLAELEITLEGEGRLDEFQQIYQRLYPKKDWDQAKNLVALAMLQQAIQLVTGNSHAQLVGAIEHVDDGVRVSVVAFPERTVATLAAHIEHTKRQIVPREFFDRKTNRRDNLVNLRLLALQVVNQGRFPTVVQSDHEDVHLFLRKAEGFQERVQHYYGQEATTIAPLYDYQDL